LSELKPELEISTWLPNGNILAYIRVNAVSGNGDIYIISTSGAGREQAAASHIVQQIISGLRGKRLF
jgi:hypothetical protein